MAITRSRQIANAQGQAKKPPARRNNRELPLSKKNAAPNHAAPNHAAPNNVAVDAPTHTTASVAVADATTEDIKAAKKARKTQKKYDNEIPLQVSQKIAARYNEGTREAESNLSETGVIMPNPHDVSLAVLPATKDRTSNLMKLRQTNFGYTDFRCNGGETKKENLLIDYVSNYDNFFNFPMWKEFKTNVRRRHGTTNNILLFSPGHFRIDRDDDGNMIIVCTRCTHYFEHGTPVSVTLMGRHANICQGNVDDHCTCGMPNPTAAHVNQCRMYNEDHLNMLSQLQIRLTLRPDEAAMIGKRPPRGERSLGIAGQPIRSFTKTTYRNGRVLVNKPFIEQDEFIELCHLNQIDPSDENALALMDSEKTKKLKDFVKKYVGCGRAKFYLKRDLIQLGYGCFFDEEAEELPNSHVPGMPSSAPQLPILDSPVMPSFAQLPDRDSPMPNLNLGLSGGSFLSPSSISGFGFGSSNSDDFIDNFSIFNLIFDSCNSICHTFHFRQTEVHLEHFWQDKSSFGW